MKSKCLLCFTELNSISNIHLKIHISAHYRTRNEPQQLLTKQKTANLVTRHPLNPTTIKSCILQPTDAHVATEDATNSLKQAECANGDCASHLKVLGFRLQASTKCRGPVGCKGKWPRQADLVNGKTVPTSRFQSWQSTTSYCQIPVLPVFNPLVPSMTYCLYSVMNYHPLWNSTHLTPIFSGSYYAFNYSTKELKTH
jgi:hypothetical protein